MGIYDNKKQVNFKFGFSWKKLKYPTLLIIGIIIIVFAFFAVQNLLQPRLISAVLNPNPLDLAQAQTTTLTVDVVNTTRETASNSIVRVSAIASEMFVITPETQAISTLEANGRRQFVFQARPFNKNNPDSQVPAGDYVIRIEFELNEKKFSEEIVLQIKKAV